MEEPLCEIHYRELNIIHLISKFERIRINLCIWEGGRGTSYHFPFPREEAWVCFILNPFGGSNVTHQSLVLKGSQLYLIESCIYLIFRFKICAE